MSFGDVAEPSSTAIFTLAVVQLSPCSCRPRRPPAGGGGPGVLWRPKEHHRRPAGAPAGSRGAKCNCASSLGAVGCF